MAKEPEVIKLKFTQNHHPRKAGEVAELNIKLARFYLSLGVAVLCECKDKTKPCKDCDGMTEERAQRDAARLEGKSKAAQAFIDETRKAEERRLSMRGKETDVAKAKTNPEGKSLSKAELKKLEKEKKEAGLAEANKDKSFSDLILAAANAETDGNQKESLDLYKQAFELKEDESVLEHITRLEEALSSTSEENGGE